MQFMCCYVYIHVNFESVTIGKSWMYVAGIAAYPLLTLIIVVKGLDNYKLLMNHCIMKSISNQKTELAISMLVELCTA